MSGFVGLLNIDGAPLDAPLLARMIDSLRRRGPDRAGSWCEGPVGFGHTLFATTDEATREQQPCTFDGNVWLVADARIDARDDLRRALAGAGRTNLTDATDADLILHAYHAWGDHCVEHLLGDFAFAVYDRQARRLFCARDQLGARPFFYASTERAFVCSNSFATVRMHPAVSTGLDDLTIGDYLIFRYSFRREATAFADVRRLLPGHSLTVALGAQPLIRKYWELSLPTPIVYKRSEEYAEHFLELFDVAVRDRLRTRSVAVSMSGGLDSTTIAAAAVRVVRADGGNCAVRAYTAVSDDPEPDIEREFAASAAAALGIPIEFCAGDGYPPYDLNPDLAERGFPEPFDIRFASFYRAFRIRLASGSRVVLDGDDADSLLAEPSAKRFQWLARQGAFATLAHDITAYVRWFGQLPPVGIRTALKGTRENPKAIPAWLNPAFAAQAKLADRAREVREQNAQAEASSRPRSMSSPPEWPRVFGNADVWASCVPLEFRWPFMDLRVVMWLLAIPVVPWCTQKTLLRVSGRGMLPEALLRRRKTVPPSKSLVDALRRPAMDWVDRVEPAPAVHQYVQWRAVPSLRAVGADVYETQRAWLLNRWLAVQLGPT